MPARALLLSLCLILALGAQAHPLPPGAGKHWEVITTDGLRALKAEHPELVLVNVLPKIIHDEGHIPGSVNIPMGAIASSPQLPSDKEALVVFYCMGRLCMYSSRAADAAHEMGYNNIRVYREGLLGWRRAGLPVEAAATYPDVDVPIVSARDLVPGSDAYLLDLRPADHFARGHVEGAVNIDLEVLHEQVDRLPRDRRIVLIDHKGKLTRTVGRYLVSQGVTLVQRLDGGFNAWVKTGLDVAQGPAPGDREASAHAGATVE
jgi:rhodanese-related sulfurtransferase